MRSLLVLFCLPALLRAQPSAPKAEDSLYRFLQAEAKKHFDARRQAVAALKTPFDDLMAAFDDAEVWARVRDEFIACARPLVAAGAEVVLSAGGIFCTLSAREPEMHVDGAVVPNSVAWVAKLAEVAVKLDLRPSRRGTFAMAPPAAIAEFREAAGGSGGR